MEPGTSEKYLKLEKCHWWFLTRRAILFHVLSGITLPKAALILDAGCGTGANFSVLSKFGGVFGMEPNPELRKAAELRGTALVAHGELPNDIPFSEHQFDLIAALNILECIPDDQAAIEAMAQRLKRSGLLVVMVPALPLLYASRDVHEGKLRRYGRRELRRKLQHAGLQVEFVNYWNLLGTPLAALVRLLEWARLKRIDKAPRYLKSKRMNRIIGQLAATERFLLPHIPMPFGLSIVMTARKR